MAEASRALARVSQLHGFNVRETHPPFGSEARTQSGHALPAATRSATLGAQAVLVAAASDPALAEVESELDLRARLDRVVFGEHGTISVLSPLPTARSSGRSPVPSTSPARAGPASRPSVATRRGSRRLPRGRRTRRGAGERHLRQGAVHDLAFEEGRFDVVVTPAPYAEALLGFVAHGVRAARHRLEPPRRKRSERLRSRAWRGRGHRRQGVANPASMLLAAALMLGEGLGERRAAETLTNAVLEAMRNGVRTPTSSASASARRRASSPTSSSRTCPRR
jgi:hypothetical protein